MTDEREDEQWGEAADNEYERRKDNERDADYVASKGKTVRALYARPVPANLVESHQIKRDSNSPEFEGIKTAPAVAVPAVQDDIIPDGDDFNGTTPHMIKCIESLVAMNDRGILVPHGLCGHSRTLLLASANRLRQQAAPAVPAPSVPEEWRKVMTELADDLSIELDMRYHSRSHYPSELRNYENEMQLVYRARALLQSDPQPTNGDAK